MFVMFSTKFCQTEWIYKSQSITFSTLIQKVLLDYIVIDMS
jgi:hypothetical protein